MRVVFLTHNYPRAPGDLAGAFLHPLAVALRARGHDVRVVAPSDGGRGGEDVLDGVPVTRVRYASPAQERYAYTGRMQEALSTPAGWLALLGLHRALRRGARAAAVGPGDAVVHAHWWFPAGLAAPPELPTVVTLHGTDARLLDRALARPLARRAMRPGRVVTAVSRAVAEAVTAALNRPVDAAHVTPMPLSPVEHRSAGGGGLVFLGRLTAQKRVGWALEAHALLRGTHPDLALTIVGDGPARPALESQAKALGTADAVRFLGQVAPGEVGAALGNADVFVFPAEREGLGLAPLEALMAGIPLVVCRDGGGVLDIMETPGAGKIVDPGPAAIARGVTILLSDAQARTAAEAAGAMWRERLTPAKVAERCEAWYQEARRG